MIPGNNQPGRFFATAKTHKFSNFNEITLESLKLRPIVDQTGTCYYNAGKILAEYLKPLSILKTASLKTFFLQWIFTFGG